ASFFFSSRRRHTRFSRDWSSDVCSSDLWMETFAQRGGQLVIHGVAVGDLDYFSRAYDLVLVSAGKGELVQMFGRDAGRSPYSEPQRALAVAYVHGLAPRPEHADTEAVR